MCGTYNAYVLMAGASVLVFFSWQGEMDAAAQRL
jgi:hypothetical protein